MKSIVSAASIAGPATTITQLETDAEKLNIGRRLQARPGARIFEMVTIRLTDWSVKREGREADRGDPHVDAVVRR